jgi:hypothetical protein
MGDTALSKTPTTLNPPAEAPTVPMNREHWEEARFVFPIYLALAKQLKFEIPFPPAKRTLPDKPDPELFRQVYSWLDSMDQRVLVHQLRHLLQMTTLNASESGLRALIHRHLRKPNRTGGDRDKIDFLLVQYFALCAPPKVYHKQIDLQDVARVMKPVLDEAEAAPLDWCEPLETIIVALHDFRSLRDMLKTNFIAQGRKIKEAAGGMFYDPSALLAFTRFNFLMRRTLIELMHADLIAIRNGLAQLESEGVRIIDCRRFGLSDSESVSQIKQIADEWKQPFQQEYTERTVSETFEKLLNLRSDVEKGLERVGLKASGPIDIFSAPTAESRSPSVSAKAPREVREEPIAESQRKTKSPANKPPVATTESSPGAKTASAAAQQPKSADDAAADASSEFDACLEKIWEQLIATPPSRGRSMTTVKLGKARVLMSSWEVAAFVSEDGPAAEDLRRAVVARALVGTATETVKESGDSAAMRRALSLARAEVARLQESVEAAKKAKDTEAAVNLGISTKRLLSALDEAEKL